MEPENETVSIGDLNAEGNIKINGGTLKRSSALAKALRSSKVKNKSVMVRILLTNT